MCGICGFNWEDETLLKRMTKKLEHRGPDGEGLFTDANLSLGHRRLSIIDLDVRGNNPVYNEDGSICVILNGEIYNYKELRAELEKKGHRFYTKTDTEVLVHLYEEHGTKFLGRLNGMFAFCIYDMKKKSLFLSRDRIGIKPLYYYFDGERFIFASEIKAILEANIKKELNRQSFETFMFLRFTMEKTLFKNISKLSPGNFLVFNLKSNALSTKKYWDVDFTAKTNPDPKKLFSLLDNSVRLRLHADVPVGLFLSGGIDSSILAGLASRHHDNINTFSVGFESITNELPYAKIASDHFNTNHHELFIGEKHIDQLDKIVYHMDEPISDAAFLPVYYLSRFAKKKATVVLTGEGSDEVFTGYDRYKLLYYVSKFQRVFPKQFSFQNNLWRRASAIATQKTTLQRHLEGVRLFRDDELKALKVNRRVPRMMLKGRNILDKAQYFDLKTLLPNDFCMKVDKMGSAFALEGRVPFLDHNIVNWGFNLPLSARLKGWDEKHILKKTFKDLLPRKILHRRKHGFNTPADAWFKGVLKEKLTAYLDSSRHNLYEKEMIRKLLASFQKSSSSNKFNFYVYQKLWAILMFEMWHEKNIEV